MFCAHWGLRDVYKQALSVAWESPEASTLYLLMDFKEHDKLPVGPAQTGAYFYANAVQGVGVLAFFAWRGAQMNGAVRWARP